MIRMSATFFPILASGLFLTGAHAQTQSLPEFDLPVNCTDSPACFVQNMVDMDRSDKRLDATCGSSTYNGHKGTDFRVPDIPTMNKGVTVNAMADGKVVGMRNTAIDQLVETAKHKKAVFRKECGNGAMIDHGVFDGKRWTTQYCHLRQGSVDLKPGQVIKKGDRIGQIGLSGFTTFPHVHVTFRKGKQIIDPFTGLAVKPTGGNCATENHKPLFSKASLEQLKELDSPLLAAGFSSATVQKNDIMKGEVPAPKNRHPLVFYALFKNLLRGDRVQITVLQGKTIWVQQTTEPLKVDKASFSAFAGRRKGGRKGKGYIGHARIIRDGVPVFESKPLAVKYKRIGPVAIDPKDVLKPKKKKKKKK